jgi:hypothetical protein
MRTHDLTPEIIGAAIKIHRRLGPACWSRRMKLV